MIELEEITAYKAANNLSGLVYELVDKFNWFNKRTLGIQWVDATDSVGANIAEGYGRYHKKDKIKFYYNARGSLLESKHWSSLAHKRKLVTDSDYSKFNQYYEALPIEINNLIKLTNKNLKI